MASSETPPERTERLLLKMARDTETYDLKPQINELLDCTNKM